MSSDDILAELAAADPAARLDLETLDEQAWRDLRDGTPAIPAGAASVAPIRRRRPLIAGGLALALIGGGTAAAVGTYREWYVGGATDGLTCMVTWQDQLEDEGTYGGPSMSADPVADCAEYARLTGRPAIVNPVAVRWNERLVVGPRDGVPADADVLAASSPEELAVAEHARELDSSLQDYVDGGQSRCFSTADAQQFARQEIARLQLDWSVRLEPVNPENVGPCTGFIVDSLSSTVSVLPERPAPTTFPEAEQLRTQIAGRCLRLPQAEAAATRILGAEHHWPTATSTDPDADCTRVDLVVGGSLQIFLYGPE